MLDFDTYVVRHGEFGVQALVETIERKEGIRHDELLPLEARWNALMQNTASDCRELDA
jgi:hypothetical protein